MHRRRHKRLPSILLRVECVYRQRHPIVFWFPLRIVSVRGAREMVRRTNCERSSFVMRLRSIFVISFIFESCMLPEILKPISSVGKCYRRNEAHGKHSEQNSIRPVVDQCWMFCAIFHFSFVSAAHWKFIFPKKEIVMQSKAWNDLFLVAWRPNGRNIPWITTELINN